MRVGGEAAGTALARSGAPNSSVARQAIEVDGSPCTNMSVGAWTSAIGRPNGVRRLAESTVWRAFPAECGGLQESQGALNQIGFGPGRNRTALSLSAMPFAYSTSA